jgi:DNA-binding IclR family transcriptional regulator
VKSTPPVLALQNVDGVMSVTRALRILEVFGVNDAHLSLAEISRRTGLHKTTVLRIARTLAGDHYLVHSDNGTWRLGRAAGWLGACYQATFNVQEVIEPALRELAIRTGESASFYVREGAFRTCLLRVEGPKAIRHHVRIGANLPLNLGAPGRVILAFSGQAGAPYEEIRRRGFHLSLGEREPEVSSVAAPVFEAQWRLLGSLCISGPTARLPKTRLLAIAPSVVDSATRVSYALAGQTAKDVDRSNSQSTWHP